MILYIVIICILLLIYHYRRQCLNELFDVITDNEVILNIDQYFKRYKDIDNSFPVIQQDAKTILANYLDRTPRFDNVVRTHDERWNSDQVKLAYRDRKPWKTFFLKVYGKWVPDNCAITPNTYNVLKQHPNISTAFFSILPPGKHIALHHGPYRGVVRYHLGLIIPKEREKCYISINNGANSYTYSWAEGKSVMFDDMFTHEVFNKTDEYRVVLFLDIKRDLGNTILNALNDWCINSLSSGGLVNQATL